jgi:hypothetical protein
MKQNITVSLEKDLIRKARILAASRSISVSRLIGDELKRMVSQSEEYERIRKQALADLDAGFHLGGQPRPARDELHER